MITHQHCTECGHKLDAHTDVQGADEKPTEGDVSICLYCGHLTQYDADGKRGPCDYDSLPTEVKELLAKAEAARARTMRHYGKDIP